MIAVKKLRQEFNQDKWISLAIMSSFIILIVQYFALYYFNIDGTNIGKIVQLGSKVIVGLFFIYSFPIVFKRNGLLMILVYSISISIFSINYLFYPQNIVYLNDVLFNFFFISLPCFIYSFSIDDTKILKNIMLMCSLIVFIIGAIIGFLVFINKISLGLYSMSMSYYMLFPTIMNINKFFENFSINSLVLAVISMFIILSIGSRGPIMCIIVYVMLYFIINMKRQNIKKILFNIIILTLIFIGLIYLKEILTLLNNILNNFGIYSRSITLFLKDEIHLSGRDKIYSNILYQIKARPICGIGLAGDRVYSGGSYSHNILLEIISGFGVIMGTCIIIVLVIIIIKSLFSKDIKKSNLMLIWFCIGVVPLMVSGSYLTDFQFWIYMGLSIRFIKERGAVFIRNKGIRMHNT